ncbi:MAG: hypothetical protein ACPGU7_01880, partial [Gammaproteobacteria bacterium]
MMDRIKVFGFSTVGSAAALMDHCFPVFGCAEYKCDLAWKNPDTHLMNSRRSPEKPDPQKKRARGHSSP